VGDGQERTEEATEFRKRKARAEGTVAKSMDLANALGLMAMLAMMPFLVSSIGGGFLTSFDRTFRHMAQPSAEGIAPLLAQTALPVLPGLGILIVVAAIVGVTSNVGQFGFLVAPKVLNPTMQKLNPMNGLKRIFSVNGLVEGAKALAKTAVFGWIAYADIVANLVKIANLAFLPAPVAMLAAAQIAQAIVLKIAGLWLFLAAIDFFFQRKQTAKQLRMTKQEVRQEMKDQESSPELKMQRLRRGRQYARGRVADAIQAADVVLANPTHYSVALKYEPGKDVAPMVVAKGADFLALRIRELAKEHKVPVVTNPPLARALYRQCEVGDAVPRELFQPVAEVLAFVYQTLKRVRR
jgi:flagellar biosynthetic protein FlhB